MKAVKIDDAVCRCSAAGRTRWPPPIPDHRSKHDSRPAGRAHDMHDRCLIDYTEAAQTAIKTEKPGRWALLSLGTLVSPSCTDPFGCQDQTPSLVRFTRASRCLSRAPIMKSIVRALVVACCVGNSLAVGSTERLSSKDESHRGMFALARGTCLPHVHVIN